nr:MAG TPA_asm: hypothetical protein [Caudoviricetes sp.]
MRRKWRRYKVCPMGWIEERERIWSRGEWVRGAVSRECEWMTYYYSRNGFCLPFLTCPRCMFCRIIDVVASKSA